MQIFIETDKLRAHPKTVINFNGHIRLSSYNDSMSNMNFLFIVRYCAILCSPVRLVHYALNQNKPLSMHRALAI